MHFLLTPSLYVTVKAKTCSLKERDPGDCHEVVDKGEIGQGRSGVS